MLTIRLTFYSFGKRLPNRGACGREGGRQGGQQDRAPRFAVSRPSAGENFAGAVRLAVQGGRAEEDFNFDEVPSFLFNFKSRGSTCYNVAMVRDTE